MGLKSTQLDENFNFKCKVCNRKGTMREGDSCGYCGGFYHKSCKSNKVPNSCKKCNP